MAQGTNSSKKNTAASKKTDTSTKKTDSSAKKGGKTANTVPPEPVDPKTRQITAFVFFFIAVFIIISYFNTEGAVIAFGANLIKGLFGWGFWLSAPAFLLASILLLFSGKKPIAMRVTAVFLLPVFFAALGNLFFGDPLLPDFDL